MDEYGNLNIPIHDSRTKYHQLRFNFLAGIAVIGLFSEKLFLQYA